MVSSSSRSEREDVEFGDLGCICLMQSERRRVGVPICCGGLHKSADLCEFVRVRLGCSGLGGFGVDLSVSGPQTRMFWALMTVDSESALVGMALRCWLGWEHSVGV